MKYQGFPGGSEVKTSTCNVGDPGSIPGSGRSPGEEIDNPLQYSCLENSMNWEVHGVAKSRTGLNDNHYHFLLVPWFFLCETNNSTCFTRLFWERSKIFCRSSYPTLMYAIHLEIWRFGVCKSGVGPEILRFSPFSRWGWCCCSAGCTFE